MNLNVDNSYNQQGLSAPLIILNNYDQRDETYYQYLSLLLLAKKKYKTWSQLVIIWTNSTTIFKAWRAGATICIWNAWIN